MAIALLVDQALEQERGEHFEGVGECFMICSLSWEQQSGRRRQRKDGGVRVYEAETFWRADGGGAPAATRHNSIGFATLDVGTVF